MSKLFKRCPNCCTTSEVKLKPHLIIAGSITFFLGVVDLGITSLCFSYLTNYFYGAWWSAMIVSATGLMGTFSIRRGVVVVACVTSVFAILMAFIGVVVDGVGLSQMESMVTCASTSSYYDTENYVYYGQSKYDDDAFVCIQTYYTADTDCYCVDSGGNCFFLNGQSDCGVILGSYRTDLQVAVGMDVLCLLSILALSIVTCFSLCCPYGFKKKKTSNFKVELKANERESITSNPLQNDARPVLSRVKTFAFGSGNTATPDPNASGTGSASAAGAEEVKTPTKQQDTYSNPLAKKADRENMPAPLYSSASKIDAAFSSSAADFSFDSSPAPSPAKPTPPPPPPSSGAAGPASPPPPPPPVRTQAAIQTIGAGMSSNPLAAQRKRQLTKQVSGIEKDAAAASEEVDKEQKEQQG